MTCKLFKILSLVSLAALILAACGGNSPNGADSDTVAEVKTIHSLGECKGANEGVTKLVTSEDEYYTCSDGVWRTDGASDGKSEKDEIQSSSSPLSESSSACEGGGYDAAISILKDCRDGALYRTTQIGSQIWMAEDLGFYSFYDAQEICPIGWHLPSYSEFVILIEAVGGKKVAGKKLKSSSSPDWNGSDEYGFRAFPNGGGGLALFWSSTTEGNQVICLELDRSDRAFLDICSGIGSMSTKFRVRCLKDDDGRADNSSLSSESSSSSKNNTGSSSSSVDHCMGVAYDESTEICDSRDGQVYRITTIDIPSKRYSEVWMAENLNYAYPGDPYDYSRHSLDSTSWCYDNDPANCDTYGRLYTWAAAVGRDEDECGFGYECDLGTGDIRGVCPKGWHLPSYDEWKALIVAVDGSITEYASSNTAGTKLKSATGWNAYSGITNEDAFGFSAFPAGYKRSTDGYYSSEGYNANFWSSTVTAIDAAYCMNLLYSGDGASLSTGSDRHDQFSVRCLKD